MKRKTFIRNTAVYLPAFFLSNTILSCTKESNIGKGKTVVVAGAGLAGLAAATDLKRKGFTVFVIEGQSAAGGRIKTNRSSSLIFDEGASWIHGAQNNPISAIASSAGAITFLTQDDNEKLYDKSGTLISTSAINATYTEYEQALQQVQNSGNISSSFADVFSNLYPTRLNDNFWKYMLSAYFEFDTGADITEISSIDFDDDELFNGADVMITNGYDKVVQYLANGLDIRYNESVININYQQEKVLINTSVNQYTADFCIVTIPLGVLKQNQIQFTPALPSTKLSAISKLKMGTVNKFLLEWNSAFWDEQTQFIGYTPDTKGKFNYFLNLKPVNGANALMTFSFGNYSVQTEAMSDTDLQNEIMLHLRAVYGNSIPAPVNFRRTKWNTNPYSYGSYSFIANGARSTEFDALASSVNDKLFFAGEHTHRDYRGTVHGAYLSGIREAERIVDLL